MVIAVMLILHILWQRSRHEDIAAFKAENISVYIDSGSDTVSFINPEKMQSVNLPLVVENKSEREYVISLSLPEDPAVDGNVEFRLPAEQKIKIDLLTVLKFNPESQEIKIRLFANFGQILFLPSETKELLLPIWVKSTVLQTQEILSTKVELQGPTELVYKSDANPVINLALQISNSSSTQITNIFTEYSLVSSDGKLNQPLEVSDTTTADPKSTQNQEVKIKLTHPPANQISATTSEGGNYRIKAVTVADAEGRKLETTVLSEKELYIVVESI